MGGKSIEKEVSLNSGRTICDHLDPVKYDIIPIFQTTTGFLYLLPWRFLHRGKISDFEYRLDAETKKVEWDSLKKIIDFVYIALHGRYAEDGTLQGFLELLNIPYLGSNVFSSALCMDKIVQKKFLSMHRIETPRHVSVTSSEIKHFNTVEKTIVKKLAAQNIKLPYVVKPYKEGSSLGVSVVFNEDDLAHAVYSASSVHPGEIQTVLIEEKIEGMEFSCVTITDNKTGTLLPLPPTQIITEKNTHIYDYEQKYMPGRAHKITPPNCAPEMVNNIQQTCVAVMHALGLTNFSRIDGFVTDDNRIIIVDPNSLSGMDPASFLFREAAEINMGHTQLINHLIETECYQYDILKHTQGDSRKQNIMKEKKTRVAVLMGGDSNEREISLASGRNITYKLSPQKYEAIPIFVTDTMELYRINQSALVRNSTTEIKQLLNKKDKILWHDLPKITDFIFIGLHGGKGENGCVQGTLEMLGVPYNGSSVLTSSLCMDKYKTTQFLKENNFDVPRSYLIEKKLWQKNKDTIIANIESKNSFPLVIKPHDDGCSFFVQKATDHQELIGAVEMLFDNNKKYVLIEEFIGGMELTVGVIGNEKPQALVPSHTIAQSEILSMKEKFLPGAGENQTPAPLSKQALIFVQKTIEKVYAALNCKGYARIDCFYQTAKESSTGQQRVVILEINTLPGMTPATCIFHQAAEIGIKPMDFVDTIIQFGFEQHTGISTKEVAEIKRKQV